MPTGLQVFRRSDGASMLQPGDRLCKILNMGYTQGQSFGAFDVPEWANSPGWLAIMSPYNYNDGWTIPDVYKDPTQVRWARRAGGSAPTAPIYILWGIY